MINKFWSKFNIVTKDHFYHNGSNIENRRTLVEALVCNFDTNNFETHSHGLKVQTRPEQLAIHWNEQEEELPLTTKAWFYLQDKK